MTDAIGGESSPTGSGAPSRRVQWSLVVGLSVMSAAAAAYEISPASVTPLVMPGLGVGAVAAGWIVSVMYGTAVLVSVPTGVALDRWNPRAIVAFAAAALLVAGGWGWVAATAGAYWSLVASRVLGGVSYVVIWNAGIAIIGSSFRADRRATAVGIFTASAPAGFALGQFGGPQVAAVLGWQAIFPVFAVLGAVGIAVFWPASRHLDGPPADGGRPSVLSNLGAVFTDRRVVVVSALAFLGYCLYIFLNTWLPTYLTEELGLTLAASGLLVALFPAVGIAGRTASGLLSDRLFGGRRGPVERLSFLVAAPVMAGFAVFDAVALVLGLLVVAGVAIQLGLGLVFVYVRELVEPGVQGTAVAVATSVALFGAFVAPIAAGSLIERTGSYRPAFLAATLVGVAGVALAFAVPEPDS